MTTTITESTNSLLLAPPDILAAQARADDVEVRAVSFRGTAHELFGHPRQDCFSLSINDRWIGMIVADGIGSCENSHRGAAAVASTLATTLETGALDPEDGGAVMESAATAARDAAELLGVDPDSVSTTLTLGTVARTPEEDGSRRALIHAVGDSPALLLNLADATWEYLTGVDDGPSNVVKSWVPNRSSEYTTLDISIPAGAVLVLATDGFTIPLGDGTGALGNDLATRWAHPRSLLQYLIDLSFNAYHDDKTVVALWNPEASNHTAVPIQVAPDLT